MRRTVFLAPLWLAVTASAVDRPATVDELIQQLAAPEVPIRRNASLRLKELGPAALPALPALMKALDDGDKQVWTNSINAIAAIGPQAKDAIPSLLEDLDSRRGRNQRSYFRDQLIVRTAYALSRIGPAAVPKLIEGLSSPDSTMRCGCARAIAGMGPAAAEAVPALVENLSHSEKTVQQESTDALSAIGKAAQAPLVAALTAPSAATRANAAQALGGMGSAAREAAPALFARVPLETESSVRAALLTALPRVGGEPSRLVPLLIEGLKDSREEIRHAATNGLLTSRAAQPQIVAALARIAVEPQADSSERAIYVLGRLGEAAAPAVPALLQVAVRQNPPAPTVIDSLVQIGDPAVGPLLLSAEKVDPGKITPEFWVVKCVQQMGGLAADAVARHLVQPSPTVRLLAARILMTLGEDARQTATALLKATDDPDVRVRAAALIGLAAVGAPMDHLESRLKAAFKDKDPLQRSAAVEAVVRLGDAGKDFRPAVLSALRDSDPKVRQTVLDQISGDFGDAVGVLAPLLDDPARRGPVIDALGRLGPAAKPAAPKLAGLLSSSTKEEQVRILHALGRLGPAASDVVSALDQAMKQPDPQVRIAAIEAGVLISTKPAMQVSILDAGLDDADRSVRVATAEVIKRLGFRVVATAPRLLALAEKDEDREFALATLSQLEVRDVPKLTELLRHPNRDIRFFAVKRLESIGPKARDAVPTLEELGKSNDREFAQAARRAIRFIVLK